MAELNFDAMMRALMIIPGDKVKDSSKSSKIEPMVVVTDLGFDGMQIKSFFRPNARRRKC